MATTQKNRILKRKWALPIKLEKLLSNLNDGVWHNVDEIVDVLEIPQSKFEQVMKLLTETDMVYYNSATNQVKLNQEWKMPLINQKETNPETSTKRENAAIGTLIIPPQKTLIIQCTRITNLTDIDLELDIRIDKKLSEIAINKLQ
jgi:hypothetical protein